MADAIHADCVALGRRLGAVGLGIRSDGARWTLFHRSRGAGAWLAPEKPLELDGVYPECRGNNLAVLDGLNRCAFRVFRDWGSSLDGALRGGQRTSAKDCAARRGSSALACWPKGQLDRRAQRPQYGPLCRNLPIGLRSWTTIHPC